MTCERCAEMEIRLADVTQALEFQRHLAELRREDAIRFREEREAATAYAAELRDVLVLIQAYRTDLLPHIAAQLEAVLAKFRELGSDEQRKAGERFAVATPGTGGDPLARSHHPAGSSPAPSSLSVPQSGSDGNFAALYDAFSGWFMALDPARYDTSADAHDAAWMGWQAATAKAEERERQRKPCHEYPLSVPQTRTEPDWRRSWYCGRCDKDTPTLEDGKCPVCTKYKALPQLPQVSNSADRAALLANLRSATKGGKLWGDEYMAVLEAIEILELPNVGTDHAKALQSLADGLAKWDPDPAGSHHPAPSNEDAVAGREGTSDFEIWIGDEIFAQTSGPRDRARAEAFTYAAKYEADGEEDVKVFEVTRKFLSQFNSEQKP